MNTKNHNTFFKLKKSCNGSISAANYSIIDVNESIVREMYTTQERAEKIVSALNAIHPTFMNMDSFESKVVLDIFSSLR